MQNYNHYVLYPSTYDSRTLKSEKRRYCENYTKEALSTGDRPNPNDWETPNERIPPNDEKMNYGQYSDQGKDLRIHNSNTHEFQNGYDDYAQNPSHYTGNYRNQIKTPFHNTNYPHYLWCKEHQLENAANLEHTKSKESHLKIQS